MNILDKDNKLYTFVSDMESIEYYISDYDYFISCQQLAKIVYHTVQLQIGNQIRIAIKNKMNNL